MLPLSAHWLQSMYRLFLKLVPMLTVAANGMIEIRTSPSVVTLVLSLVTRSFAAVCNAGILPELAIDPVLSSAIATRIFVEPQLVVELTLKLSDGYPATFMKSVGNEPEPVMTTFAGVPPLLAVYAAVTAILPTSG